MISNLHHRLIPHDSIAYALAASGYKAQDAWVQIAPSLAYLIHPDLVWQAKAFVEAKAIDLSPIDYILLKLDEDLAELPIFEITVDGPLPVELTLDDDFKFRYDVYDRYVIAYPSDSAPDSTT